MTKLYKHQQEILEALDRKEALVLGWSVGLGKTLPMIKIISKSLSSVGGRYLIVCPPSVMYNWKNEIAKFAPVIASRTVVLHGTRQKRLKLLNNKDFKIFIINYQGLRVLKEELSEVSWEILVLDELHLCLHYDTKVLTDRGEIKIGEIVNKSIDCKVASWNFSSNELQYKSVVHRYKNYVNERQVEIKYGNTSIRASESHKIYTSRGWKKAIQISDKDYLYTLQEGVYGESFQKPLKKILFREMRSACALKGKLRKNEKTQSNVYSWSKGKGNKEAKGKEVQGARGERSSNKTARGDIQENIVTAGISYKNIRKAGERIPRLLQGRFSNPRKENSDRNRRERPQVWKEETARHKENKKIRAVRVESVKILELGSGQRYRTRSEKDKFLYDIEVEDNHNYFANNILVHNCKTPTSQQSKAAYLVSMRSKRRYGLTGTMIANSLLDVFQQMLVIDHGKTFGTNYYTFRAKYFMDKNASWRSKHGYFPKWEVRPDYVELIEKAMAKVVDVRFKKDCLDLPPQIFMKRYCELEGEQLKCYLMMEKEMIAFLKDNAMVATTALTKIIRLNQITSGHIVSEQDNETVEFDNNAKLKLLKEVIEEIDGKCIIWTVFKSDVKQITKMLELLGHGYRELHGDVAQENRQQYVDEFNEDDSVRFMVANIQTGGVGINLTGASVAVIYSMNYNLVNYLQALGRNHRGGSQIHEDITYIHLLCKDTIDEIVINAIERKGDFANAILNNLLTKD